MVDWIHSDAAGLGPRVTLDSKLVFSAGRLCNHV